MSAVSIENYGAQDDGTDQSSAISLALNSESHVLVPSGKTFICKNLPAPDNVTFEINGTLKLPNFVFNEDAIIKDNNVSGFKIIGRGILDGNRYNQSSSILTSAVRLDGASDCLLDGLTVKDFYADETATIGLKTTVHMSSGTNNIARNIKLEDWSLEGIKMVDVQYSTICNITAIDNAQTSWSAVQMSGPTNSHNLVANVAAYNTGASAVGMDSRYSAMVNVVVDTVRFQNGINLGHVGQDSSHSVVSNVVVKNIADPKNANSAGISVVANSKNISISQFSIDGSTQKGINISAGAHNVKLSNGQIKDSLTAVSVFNAGDVDINNLRVEDSTYGINKDAGTVMRLTNVDLRGATSEALSGSKSNIIPVNLDLSNDSRSSGVSIAQLGAGGTVVVNNDNIISSSRIIIEPANDSAASALPFIQSYGNGSFTVRTTNSASSGAFLRYQIV